MLSVVLAVITTFVCLYGLYLAIRIVAGEEDALIITAILSLAVGLLMIDYIWPWGIF